MVQKIVHSGWSKIFFCLNDKQNKAKAIDQQIRLPIAEAEKSFQENAMRHMLQHSISLPINPALKSSVLSLHYSGSQSLEESACPHLTPDSYTYIWPSTHWTFPEGFQNKFIKSS